MIPKLPVMYDRSVMKCASLSITPILMDYSFRFDTINLGRSIIQISKGARL